MDYPHGTCHCTSSVLVLPAVLAGLASNNLARLDNTLDAWEERRRAILMDTYMYMYMDVSSVGLHLEMRWNRVESGLKINFCEAVGLVHVKMSFISISKYLYTWLSTSVNHLDMPRLTTLDALNYAGEIRVIHLKYSNLYRRMTEMLMRVLGQWIPVGSFLFSFFQH